MGVKYLGSRSDCVHIQRYRHESRYGSRYASICFETYRIESSRARESTADVVGSLLFRPLLRIQDWSTFDYQR
jgi:hypothetical protein